MTTQQHLLNSFLALFLLISITANADEGKTCSAKFKVLERTKRSKYDLIEKDLKDLKCNKSFEGKFFKVVLATEDDAIKFDHEDKTLLLKAANVYYHLTLARDYWVNEIKSDFVQNMQQVTVRLDITNSFSNTRHFKNAELEKNYNNAWSIPEGQTPRIAGQQKKWFKEIWFSPMKKIESRKEVISDGSNPIHQSLILIKEPVLNMNTNSLIYQGLGLAKYPTLNSSIAVESALSNLGTIAVLLGLIEVTKHMDKMFMDKYYFVDTAMVPEIIYHEYAHIAMSDTMKTVHSVPVIEGMADYFATRVANRKKMYSELKKISNNRSKNPENRNMYNPYLEGAWNANSDFTLSVLWKGKMEFDKVNKQRISKKQKPLVNYDNLVFHAHHHLDEYSDIHNDLTKALIEACKEKCEDLRPGVNTINYVLESKGFN